MNESVLTRSNVKVFRDGSQPMLFAHGFGCDQHTRVRNAYSISELRLFDRLEKQVAFADYLKIGSQNKVVFQF